MKIEVKQAKSNENDYKVFVNAFKMGRKAAQKAWGE